MGFVNFTAPSSVSATSSPCSFTHNPLAPNPPPAPASGGQLPVPLPEGDKGGGFPEGCMPLRLILICSGFASGFTQKSFSTLFPYALSLNSIPLYNSPRF